ncbi:patatin [Elizabethkingia argentiflava]|uniref:Patatin n=1 Tax=Elizabethkingia argenteiflava TaxID=2681556 RepID=A0A845PXY0_9FLAO|nr:patatin-like phospholipase family protein [Elizabethkingia argenteiflava]NAW50930.1 patatin [Elizabethkingia argenteiflava]
MEYKTGLVLSGGGTKGIAHAGVLKFLEDEHIKIDKIAGTSAGALVGALYAFGNTPEDILAFFQSVHFFNWKHLVFNKPGFISSDIFRIYLDPVFGKAKIKESKIPLLLTATDLATGTLQVFDEDTEIIDAIISSAAIPGVATPYTIDGKIYCDGGVINNFPADLLHDKVDKLVGVYLSPMGKVSRDRIKSIRAVTGRALEILLYRSEMYKFELCDWLVPLNKLNHYSPFETKKHRTKEIFDIGYTTAKETFQESLFYRETRDII